LWLTTTKITFQGDISLFGEKDHIKRAGLCAHFASCACRPINNPGTRLGIDVYRINRTDIVTFCMIALSTEIYDIFDPEDMPAQSYPCQGLIHNAFMKNGTGRNTSSAAKANILIKFKPITC